MKINFESDITFDELDDICNMCRRAITAGYDVDIIFKRGYLSEDGQKYEYGITLAPVVLSETNEALDEI